MSIFETEEVPEDLVTGDMLMIYKKNERNKRTCFEPPIIAGSK